MEPRTYKTSGSWVVATVIFWLIAGVLASFTVVVPLAAVAMIVRAVLKFVATSVTLDQSSVTLRLGLLSVNETRFPITNINSVSTSFNIVGERFGYGSIALSVGNDRNEIKLSNLDGCRDLKERLEPLLVK